jgi:hypothetical protein
MSVVVLLNFFFYARLTQIQSFFFFISQIIEF